jgi:hypothetical protein
MRYVKITEHGPWHILDCSSARTYCGRVVTSWEIEHGAVVKAQPAWLCKTCGRIIGVKQDD